MVFGSLFPEEENKSSPLDAFQSLKATPLINAVFNDVSAPQVGRIRRVKPFHPDDLSTPAVQALKRNLDEKGISEFAPKFYAMRSERMFRAGIITQGGLGFTEKGKMVIKKYFQEKGLSEKAIENKTLKSALKIEPDRGEAARGALKYTFGYQLDSRGMTFRSPSHSPAPSRSPSSHAKK